MAKVLITLNTDDPLIKEIMEEYGLKNGSDFFNCAAEWLATTHREIKKGKKIIVVNVNDSFTDVGKSFEMTNLGRPKKKNKIKK